MGFVQTAFGSADIVGGKQHQQHQRRYEHPPPDHQTQQQ